MAKDLPRPLRKQREVLYLPVVGHTAILGTAGSGKTTLALYRAAYLSSPDMSHHGKTLLLTYNKALITYLKFLKPVEFSHVHIENYHTFARGYLNARKKMKRDCICDYPEPLIEAALKEVSSRYQKHPFFDRPIKFFIDEIKWILSHGIVDKSSYIEAERAGRNGTRVRRELRKIMFEIRDEYLKKRFEAGKLYDWDDIAYYVHQELLVDESERLYKHIIVDEGQDFSPEMLRSLSHAIPKDGSLTFFGDVAQQIYGQRTSWRSAGLKVAEAWEFKENYRNTKQIAELGLSISKMSFFKEIADIVEAVFSRNDGPLPTIGFCKDENHQFESAVKFAKNAMKTKSVAVLFKNHGQIGNIASLIPGSIKLHRDMARWVDGPCVYYGTYHSAKGLEFDTVILPYLDQDNLPDPEQIEVLGMEDALTHDGRLLYVATTRAKSELILLHSSSITSLLPADQKLYNTVKL